MKLYRLNFHTEWCLSQNKESENDWPSAHFMCQISTQQEVFMMNGEFIIIEFHLCVQGHDKHDFMYNVIKSYSDRVKQSESCFLHKQKPLDYIKKFNEINSPLKKKLAQVHYVYEDAARKQYAIFSLVNFFDGLDTDEAMAETYRNELKELKLKDLEYLNGKISKIICANMYRALPERVVISSINALVSNLK